MTHQTHAGRGPRPWNVKKEEMEMYQVVTDYYDPEKQQICDIKAKINSKDISEWVDMFQNHYGKDFTKISSLLTQSVRGLSPPATPYPRQQPPVAR